MGKCGLLHGFNDIEVVQSLQKSRSIFPALRRFIELFTHALGTNWRAPSLGQCFGTRVLSNLPALEYFRANEVSTSNIMTQRVLIRMTETFVSRRCPGLFNICYLIVLAKIGILFTKYQFFATNFRRKTSISFPAVPTLYSTMSNVFRFCFKLLHFHPLSFIQLCR